MWGKQKQDETHSLIKVITVHVVEYQSTLAMAPAVEEIGIWGTPTATIDWCEENYKLTPYVAEFCKWTFTCLFPDLPVYLYTGKAVPWSPVILIHTCTYIGLSIV